jgi:hypothetical protein
MSHEKSDDEEKFREDPAQIEDMKKLAKSNKKKQMA